MMAAGDVPTGGKRKDISPLSKLAVKKSKGMETEEIDRIGVEPTFKVSTKNSAEQGGKWESIGTVLFREPGMYGRLSQDSIRENILVELGLMDE